MKQVKRFATITRGLPELQEGLPLVPVGSGTKAEEPEMGMLHWETGAAGWMWQWNGCGSGMQPWQMGDICSSCIGRVPASVSQHLVLNDSACSHASS